MFIVYCTCPCRYGNWGVGESCHESQWVYGVGNVYAYTTSTPCVVGLSATPCGGVMVHAEGPSPTGIRTFFYNDTLLLASDSTWCTVDGARNLTQFWNNSVHTPSGKGTGARCRQLQCYTTCNTCEPYYSSTVKS